MEPEVIISIIAGIVSMIAGGVASSRQFKNLFRRILGLPNVEQVAYAERLSKLTKKLQDTSGEVDEILKEIGRVSDIRQQMIASLEKKLTLLENKEVALKDKISALENTPVEAAEHFAALVSDGEKRGANRDYLLFGAGVVLSTILAISIHIFFG